MELNNTELELIESIESSEGKIDINQAGVDNIKLSNTCFDFVVNHNYSQVIFGPVGSGKSTACVVKIFVYACIIRKNKNGKRKSKFIVVRNTRKELKDTTVKTFLFWLGKYGTYKQTDMIFEMKFDDVECEVSFLALDRDEDKKKLLSLETSGFYLNELREIDETIYTACFERMGRYPPKETYINEKGESIVTGGCVFDLEKAKEFGIELDYEYFEKHPDDAYLKCLFADTNAPAYDSFYYKLFEKKLFDKDGTDKNPKDFKLFRQPPGDSPYAENLLYLDKDYYDKFIQNKPKDEVDVQVRCQYSKGKNGIGVYEDYFDINKHVQSNLFKRYYNGNSKILLSFDYGLNPACVVGQFIDNEFYVYDIVITKNDKKRGLEDLIKDDLLKLLKEKYIYHKNIRNNYLVVGDPAGTQRNQGSGKQTIETLKKYGFNVFTKDKNNQIDYRINAVKTMLRNYGKEYLFIERLTCNFLINGLNGNYHYEKEKNGFKDIPCKNEYSHVQDALQYACVHIVNNGDTYLKNTSNYNYNFNNDSSGGDSLIGY